MRFQRQVFLLLRLWGDDLNCLGNHTTNVFLSLFGGSTPVASTAKNQGREVNGKKKPCVPNKDSIKIVASIDINRVGGWFDGVFHVSQVIFQRNSKIAFIRSPSHPICWPISYSQGLEAQKSLGSYDTNPNNALLQGEIPPKKNP